MVSKRVLLFVLAGCSSSSGGASGGGGGAIPETSFVFVRSTEIVAYDISSQEERVVATLDSTSRPSDVAISPDRKKVAFVGVFRPGGESVKGDEKAVWSVSSDGSGFTRLTPPVAPDSAISDQAIDRTSPAWTPDGSAVVFVLATTGKKGSQSVDESALFHASPEGVAAYAGVNADCALFSSPHFSSDGTSMTAILKACSKSANGIALYDVVPPAAPSSRVAGTDGADGPAIVSGDVLYYRVQVGAHTAIVSRPVAGGKQRTIYAPPDANVAGFDLSPDGTQIVAGVGGCSIVLVSSLDAAAPTATTITTNAGGSCTPSWK